MIRHLIAFIACAGISLSAHAQIKVIAPATDRALESHQERNLLEQAKRLLELQKQLQQAEREFSALTGNRGIGGLHNNAELRDTLVPDWKEQRDSAGKGKLTGRAKDEYDKRQMYDRCAIYRENAQSQENCRAAAVTPTQDRVMWQDAHQKATARTQQIERLLGEISKTNDPKSIAELQARIGAEELAISNERSRMETAKAAMAAANKEQEEQERQLAVREVSKSRGINLDAVSW